MRSLKPISKDIRKVVAVVCTDPYDFHEDMFIRIVFWGQGYWEDRPSKERLNDLVRVYKRLEVVKAPCKLCRMEGAE